MGTTPEGSAASSTCRRTSRLERASRQSGPPGIPSGGFPFGAGMRLGPCEVLRPLGRGATCDVYAAHHVTRQHRVAIKVLRDEWASRPVPYARFMREAEAATRLCHPNAVEVLEVGEQAGTPYLVMECLFGEDLEAFLTHEGVVPIQLAVDLMLPIVSALAQGHRRGVLHRDVKPSNIFLSRQGGRAPCPKLLDFGVSRLHDLPSLTASRREVLGTPHYMAPEQARGEALDGRVDQYAVGAVLYEMLTSAPPHAHRSQDDSVVRLLSRVAHGPAAEPIRHYNRGVNPDVEAVVLKALSRDPVDRFSSMEALGHALSPFASAVRPRRRIPPSAREPLCDTLEATAVSETRAVAGRGFSQPGLSQPGLSQPGLVLPLLLSAALALSFCVWMLAGSAGG